MGNILQSDFYRLFRSRAFYVCTIVASGLMVLGAFLSKLIVEKTNIGMELPFESGLQYGLTAFSDSDVNLYMAIFIAIFVTSEFTHGTMKNTISKGFSKVQVYVSKLITMSVATFLLMLVMFVFGTITGIIITGEIYTTLDIPMVLLMLGIEFLLHTALASLFVMVAMIIKSNGGTIAVNIIAIISFGPTVFALLDYLAKKTNTFQKLSLQMNISYFSNYMSSTNEDVIRAILVALVYLAITTALGIFAFHESDIK